MKHLTCWILVAFLSAVTFSCDEDDIPSECKGAITFPDPGLEAAVRWAIQMPEGDIHYSDLEEIDWLSTSTYDVSDLTNIHCLSNLVYLTLYDNQISDIGPLSELTSLRILNLGTNQIRDISPLGNLTDMVDLALYDNQIEDISPLRDMTSLVDLKLHYNRIRDITPLIDNAGIDVRDRVDISQNNLASCVFG